MAHCSKPGCANRASALLAYDYSQRMATLDHRPEGPSSPHLYVLCLDCADRLTPPRGWQLIDRRRPVDIPA